MSLDAKKKALSYLARVKKSSDMTDGEGRSDVASDVVNWLKDKFSGGSGFTKNFDKNRKKNKRFKD